MPDGEFSPLSLPVVLDRVAQAMDGAGMQTRLGKGREDYQVWVEIDDINLAKEIGWFRWGFGAKMSFLFALRVSGDLSSHWKDQPSVRVVLLEDGDGMQLIGKRRGKCVYAPREVIVWRGGVMDPK